MKSADFLIEEILTYWFGIGNCADLPDANRTLLWFGAEVHVDEHIKTHYEATLCAAVQGQLNHWLSSARGRLAYIIVLDQFSRNIYRGSAKAFAQDGLALHAALTGIKQQLDKQLSLIERVFFYLPLEHAEDLAKQQQSVVLFRELHRLALPETRAVFQTFVEYAEEHHNVIEQFGRFPYRNVILGRVTTATEKKYLEELHQQKS